MAEVSEKPPVTVDVGQLAFERSIDNHLRIIFEPAVRWGAVMLLDEADVVLEKTSWENHARNAFVSGRYTFPIVRCTHGNVGFRALNSPSSPFNIHHSRILMVAPYH